MTGTLIHEPLALILNQAQAEDAVPSDAFVYAAITAGLVSYDRIVEKRGLRLSHDEMDLATKVAEQKALLEALVWAWTRVVLTTILKDWTIVLVESEELSVVGCTCGLGDLVGAATDHDARECAGIVWMTRGDVILKSRTAPYRYRYDDFKSTGDASMNWEAAWQYRVQMKAGVLGAEQRLGVTIDEVYIHGLIKGRAQAEWNPEEGKASGPKYQNSGLIYGGYRAANLPLLLEQWAAKWKGQYYLAEDGKRRKMTADFPRTGVWTLSPTYWKDTGCQSAIDYWTRWLGVYRLGEAIKVVGPIYRKQWELDQFLRQLVSEERRFQDGLLDVYQHLQEGYAWGSPEIEALLDVHFPQSRGSHCHSFFGDTCEHLNVCNHEPGWESPELLGMIPRRPHHQAELEQMIGRGLMAEADLADELEE